LPELIIAPPGDDHSVRTSGAGELSWSEIRATRNMRVLAKHRSRAKIVHSARRLFVEKGYGAATIREIAAGAGLSTGAVFTSFVDKSELLIAVLSAEHEALAATMRQAAVGATLEDRLLGMFEAGYRYALANLPLIQDAISVSWCPIMGGRIHRHQERWPTAQLIRDVVSAAESEAPAGLDVALVSQMLWDCFIVNLRHAAHDGWKLRDLTARVKAQTRILLTPPAAA
jgi:AcrR family transcriptional regulator